MPDRSESEERVPQDEISPLRRSAASGVRSMSIALVVQGALLFLQLAVLGRLLSAKELGVVGILIVITSLGRAVVDFGLSASTIARQTRDPATLSTLFWTNAIAGLLTGAILVAASPALVAFFDTDKLALYMPILGAGFVAVSLGQLSSPLLERELRFTRLAGIEIVATIAAAVATIGTAFAGAGAGSMALGFASGSMVRSAMLVASEWEYWRPAWTFQRSRLTGHLWFGSHFAGQKVVTLLAANVDYVVIGHFLGAAALGSYTLAYEVVVRPYQQLNPALTRVAFPVFAQRQDDDAALRRGSLEVVRLIGFVVLPILGAIVALGPDLIPTVFGSGWETTVSVLPIVALVGAIRSLENPTGSIFLAKSRPDLGLGMALFTLSITVLTLLLAAQVSLLAVAWANVGVVVVAFLVRRTIIYRLIGLTLRQYLHAISRALGFTVVAVGLTVAVRASLNLPAGAALFVLGAVFVTAVGAQILLFERTYLRYLLRLVRARSAGPPHPSTGPRYRADRVVT